jgi:hypothetical protein
VSTYADRWNENINRTPPVEGRDVRFPINGGAPILASAPGYDVIPFTSDRLTLIGLGADQPVTYAKTLKEKRAVLFSHPIVLIAWPGKVSMDIFYIDDVDAARRALGLRLAGDDVIVDGTGREWRLSENDL